MIPEVHKIKSGELELIAKAAQADDHYLIAPTHVVKKGGEIVGYWSVSGIPHVHLWHDSQKVTPRDSCILRNMMDTKISDLGYATYIMYCEDKSPYMPHVEKLGFHTIGKTNLLTRRID